MDVKSGKLSLIVRFTKRKSDYQIHSHIFSTLHLPNSYLFTKCVLTEKKDQMDFNNVSARICGRPFLRPTEFNTTETTIPFVFGGEFL